MDDAPDGPTDRRPSGGEPPNILFVTLDQFRADTLSVAGHPVVRTPNLDRLAASGVRLTRHYSQAAPCGPGRASLYTGMYQLNHRVVANGTPLDARFDNVALAARRAGYEPASFGYTDQAVDPRTVTDPDDERLRSYEGVLPGFDPVLSLVGHQRPWLEWLRSLDHPVGADGAVALATEPDRPAEHSLAAFLTDRAIDWIAACERPWFAHLSYLRPHPPFAAAGRFARMYDPGAIPGSVMPIPPSPDRHPHHDAMLATPASSAPTDDGSLRRLMAQYFGMVSEVDEQLGRLWDRLVEAGEWERTVVVVTSDHGEYLGDHGLVEKGGCFESSYHVLGIVRDPRRPGTHGTTVDRFTENVDVFPTLCDAMGIDVPVQCDGVPLTPLLDGDEPPWWRDAAHWEFDWRGFLLDDGDHPWPWDRRLERQHLAVRRDEQVAYVQYGNGSWECFDLLADPTWRTRVTDADTVLPAAQAMLLWRSRHAERTLTDTMIDHGVVGRVPAPSGG
jgi:arylsulfatase A-like enzyme